MQTPTMVATTLGPTTQTPTVMNTQAPTEANTTSNTTLGPTTQNPTVVATTLGPTTQNPTVVATTLGPTTQTPTVANTQAPTVVNTASNTTLGPTTQTPTVLATTLGPATQTPTVANTQAPTVVNTTSNTTLGPTTQIPTVANTQAPTVVNMTSNTTLEATTQTPTVVATTLGPTTQIPTVANTQAPTVVNMTSNTTLGPTTQTPTVVNTTLGPTNQTPTVANITITPPMEAHTAANTTLLPTTQTPAVAATNPAPTSLAPTTADGNGDECTKNPQDYDVRVDIQIEFLDNEFAACGSEDQENSINTNIAAALNQAFPTTVSDWDGVANFGTFIFDLEQEVNNVDSSARRHLGWLQSLFIMNSGNDHDEVPTTSGSRSLQEGTCPVRDVECTADYCRWGCITASTTDCGTSTVTNWGNLADDIRARLATLGYDCLGIPEELDVVLLVGDTPLNEALERSSVEPDVHDPNAILTNSDETPDAEDDSRTRTLEVDVKLQFHFFNGTAHEPNLNEIMALVQETKDFFAHRLAREPYLANWFVYFTMSDIFHHYEESPSDEAPTAVDADIFELDFLAHIEVLEPFPYKAKDLAKTMADSDFESYIERYVWESPPFQRNQFYETKNVVFVSKASTTNQSN
jgi:hypothetical protein